MPEKIKERNINLEQFSLNEMFYSVQGEGIFCGTPMIFVRFAGCNLKCQFCDTDHKPKMVYKPEELYDSITKWIDSRQCNRILFTGGEPTLQLFTRIGVELIKKLHKDGVKMFMETNGTIHDGFEILHLFTWITLSPKMFPAPIQMYNEIKIVVAPDTIHLIKYFEHEECLKFLQPNDNKNIEQVIGLVKRLPHDWRMSLQVHKLVGIK